MLSPDGGPRGRSARRFSPKARLAQRSRGRAEIFRATLLWLPALLVTALVLLPLVYLCLRAMGADRAAWGFILGPRSAATLLRSLGLVLAVTAASIGLALPLAWLTVRSDLPLARFWSVMTALPLVIPSYIGAYLYVAMLGPRGMLQQWLEGPFGLQRLPDIYGFPGAFLVLTLFTYPYLLLLLRASLQQMDPALEAASRSLGQGPWPTFRRVVLPQLRPSLAAGSLLVALYTLRDFGAVSIMRYDSFTRVIYLQYKSAFDRSSAALMALTLALVAGVLVSLERSAARRARYHRAGAQTARPAQPIRLGIWRWPALLLCALVSLAGLILPAAVLGYWLWRGLAAGERLAELGPALWGSLSGAGLAASFTLLAALPLALVTVRHPGRSERLLLGLTWTGYALPGLVVALGLVFFGVRYALPLYQSLLLLVAAYVILFLPMALGALRSALLQIHPSLEEAARSLGMGPSRAFRAVVLPLLRPGLAAALALVFLSAMKELPATLILSPIGFETLATRTWSAVGEAFFARAALPSLLLVALSSLPMSLLALREHSA